MDEFTEDTYCECAPPLSNLGMCDTELWVGKDPSTSDQCDASACQTTVDHDSMATYLTCDNYCSNQQDGLVCVNAHSARENTCSPKAHSACDNGKINSKCYTQNFKKKLNGIMVI